MNRTLKNNFKKIYKILGIIIAIVIICFFVKSFIENWKAIKEYLVSVDVGILLLSLILYAGVFFFTALNWTSMIGELSGRVDKIKYVHFYLYSSMARYIPGGIWNIAGKMYLCEKDGNKREGTILSIIFEYIFQIVSSLCFLMFFPGVMDKNKSLGLEKIVIIILFFLVLLFILLYFFKKRLVNKVKKYLHIFRTINLKFYIKYLLRYCGVWVLTGIAIVALVGSFLTIEKRQILVLILSYPVSWVIGFLSPTPNGIGTKEGMMLFFLQEYFTIEFLVMLTMIIRVWTMAGEILLIIVYEIYYWLKRKVIYNE